MGVRLRILEWWTPKYVIRKELRNVSDQTTKALKSLLATYAPPGTAALRKQQAPTSIEEQRIAMAQLHADLVQTLEASIGHEKAVELGRESMYIVGVNLGKQTRRKLGVGNKPKDLIRAAKILYRVLGIEFSLQQLDKTNARAIINRCALAKEYSELTCEILSATDEGVIKGLQPNANMHFKEYMTHGRQTCIAEIQFNKKETLT